MVRIKVGDIVTRLGDDRQEVIGINDLGDVLEARVVRQDKDAVFAEGELVCGLSDDYEVVV